MELRLVRKIKSESFTAGDLYVDDTLFCNTMEDTVREPGVKIDGKTAIPAGYYHVVVSMSKRFKKLMPEVLNVPNFLGIRIHSGNTSEDTEGCILVGIRGQSPNEINTSRFTFERLMDKIEKALDNGEYISLMIS